VNHVLVDTNIISYVLKSDSRAELYREHLEGSTLGVSFVTIAELEAWAALHDWGPARRERMRDFLGEPRFIVHGWFRGMSACYATVQVKARDAGRTIEDNDAWIATTALYFEIPLITHNRKDFDFLGCLRLISECG
jgi:predicted nucleic acid-binding protein